MVGELLNFNSQNNIICEVKNENARSNMKLSREYYVSAPRGAKRSTGDPTAISLTQDACGDDKRTCIILRLALTME